MEASDMPLKYQLLLLVHLLAFLDGDGDTLTRRLVGAVEIGGVRVRSLSAVDEVVRGFCVSRFVAEVARVGLWRGFVQGCFVWLMLPAVLMESVLLLLEEVQYVVYLGKVSEILYATVRPLTAEGHVLSRREYGNFSRCHDGFEMLPKCKDLLERHICFNALGVVSGKR
jgi:hypothetical protein